MSPQTRETTEIEPILLVSNPTTFLGGIGGEANYSNLEWLLQARLISHFYKISKIVRALWLAERRVCMGVCKHVWDVKMFCFSRVLIRKAQIWKCSWVEISISLLYLPIPLSVETWKIFTKHALSIFFSLKLTFQVRQICNLESLFLAKQELITRARLRVHDFTTGENFSFNQRHNKEFCVFVSRKLIYKTNRKLFSCICIAWYKHSKGWENSRQLWKPSTSSRVCI